MSRSRLRDPSDAYIRPGNIEQYGGMYAFKDVKETIYQPRIGNISTEETTVVELRVGAYAAEASGRTRIRRQGRVQGGPVVQVL